MGTTVGTLMLTEGGALCAYYVRLWFGAVSDLGRGFARVELVLSATPLYCSRYIQVYYHIYSGTLDSMSPLRNF